MSSSHGNFSDRRKMSPLPLTAKNAAQGGGKSKIVMKQKLNVELDNDHKPESYKDMKLGHFDPTLFSELEKYLPSNMLKAYRETKFKYMRNILNQGLLAK